MRQRRVKNRDSIIDLCSEYVYEGFPESDDVAVSSAYIKDSSLSDNGIDMSKPLFTEIGSGKGQFITTLAKLHPENYYLACEGGININVRILQKAKAMELNNLKVITNYITEPEKWFSQNSLDGIYINFCDPWPKDRHAHRRLTYRKLLESYKKILKPGAFLAFKTDNDELFEWSLGELEAAGFETVEMTRDLWNSEYESNNIHTEYEEKFGAGGKTINYIKVHFKNAHPFG